MANHFILSWRNLWRNKRRTLIVISSVVFSVLLASWMRSMQEGSYDSMIGNVVKFYSGYLQVQDTAYWEERILDHGFEAENPLIHGIEAINGVTLASPRLESYALAASDLHSKPAMVMGIAPEAEDRITSISRKMTGGRFLTSGDPGVIIARGLAGYLGLNTGDTLVLISQGYRGVSASGLFEIRGIMTHPNPEFDKRMVYMDIQTAREFYSAPGISTSLVVMTDDHYQVHSLKSGISKLLPQGLTVMTWNEMQPEIEQLIKSDRGSGLIMLGILYLVISFGLFSVVMMMARERKREFGITHAVGMKKRQLSVMIVLETVMIGLTGCIAGLLVSYLFCLWFFYHPLPLTGEMADATIQYGMEPYMFFSMKPSLFYSQMIVVFLICLIISLFPVYSVYRMKITRAMRS